MENSRGDQRRRGDVLDLMRWTAAILLALLLLLLRYVGLGGLRLQGAI